MLTVTGGETTNATEWEERQKQKCISVFSGCAIAENSGHYKKVVAGIFLNILFLFFCVCVTCMTRIQPIGLVERIQAIAQNMSDMAVRVEQILQRSMANSRGMTHVCYRCSSVQIHPS